jgi:hypothetical protein
VLQPGAFDSNLFWWARRSFSNNSKMKGGEGGEGEGGRKKGEKSISNLSQVQKQTQVLYF